MSKPCSLWPRETPFRENVLPAKRTNGVRIPADPNIKIALWLDSGARPCNSSLFLFGIDINLPGGRILRFLKIP